MTSRLASSVLAAILLVYLVLGAAFAILTPAWQAPDEPAHYNYVRYVAETGNFPVLHMGDYPHTYLEEIKTAGFPPGMPIDTIRYEFHQPPLYYVLAAPIYRLTAGGIFNDSLLGVRLLSVILGAGIVLLAYGTGRRIFPARPALALGSAAFVAFLPQHLATVSQVGNDVLAELLFAAVLYVLVGWVVVEHPEPGVIEHPERRPQRAAAVVEGSPMHPSTGDSGESTLRRSPAQDASAEEFRHPERSPQLVADVVEGRRTRDLSPWLLGLLLGLILITKTTAYISVPLAGVVLLWRWRRERATAGAIARDLLAVALPAALIALPWYARNIWAYGWPDILGLRRHDEIVVGQMRTPEFIAQFGQAAYWRRTFEWTFKSFWGVFGWMGVWLDSRFYFLVALLSGTALGGFALRVLPFLARRSVPAAPKCRAASLLSFSVLLTLVAYTWYNITFLQHQGRYLFTALIPLALAYAWGWDAALLPRNTRLLAGALAVFAVALAAWGVIGSAGLPKWPLALTVALGAALAVASFLPARLRGLAYAAVFALLPLLAAYALYGIVEQLWQFGG